MEIEEAIRTYLLTKSGLTALIGTRILPDDISDGAAIPCIIYKKISDVKIHTHQGQSKTEQPIFQYSAYAATKAVARQISNQVKLALCDYFGVLSGVQVQYITLLNEGSTKQNSDVGKSFIEDLEFEIIYNRE